MINAEIMMEIFKSAHHEEQQRFVEMLGIVTAKPKKQVEAGGMTSEECTENMIRRLKLNK
tara:strand:+ start:2178 stop:2357 length:180 start_codon:yes stop_codon:yes gene_type:complete